MASAASPNPGSFKGWVLNIFCKPPYEKLQTADYRHDLFSNYLRRYLNNWEKLVICSLTVGPQGAIQPVTYYDELSRATAGTFCSMFRCWWELKNGKSEQAKHVSAAWGSIRPQSPSLAASKVMPKAGMELPQLQQSATCACRLIAGMSSWAAPCCAGAVYQAVPLGGR